LTDRSPAAARTPSQPGFHASFNCLWWGRPHTTRTGDDHEGWAQRCPDCVGRAQDNEFLRYRLRDGLRRRSEAAEARAAQDKSLRDYYAARAGEYDDWYLRKGRYSHGVLADAAWTSELDQATLWLDSLPFHGEIVELAAGTGWWSPLLAEKGELSIYDVSDEVLTHARDRLLRHGLRAHIHIRDAWAEPDQQVDALFMGFWLSHVPRARLGEFMALCRRWLKPGGLLAFIDSRLDPESSATDHPAPGDDVSTRRLNDGRKFTITKVFWEPAELTEALTRAGFRAPEIRATGRFFLLGSAVASDTLTAG
jgi:demethylmenaquinone methyltransferase/2-methoxy-6-polyprenyl-1,4-benzoquinol methylase